MKERGRTDGCAANREQALAAASPPPCGEGQGGGELQNPKSGFPPPLTPPAGGGESPRERLGEGRASPTRQSGVGSRDCRSPTPDCRSPKNS